MTKLDAEKFGICKLCHQEDALRDSHIISEFLYASMYDDKHRFHVVTAGDVNFSYEQKGYRERMLCQSCETKLSKWETYARALLMGGTLLQYRREGTITWVEGIDYPRFKLFQLSILWRAGVATREFFSKVTLGPHAERCCWRRIRRALAIRLPNHRDSSQRQHGACHRSPTLVKILDAKGIRFTFGGYFWAYRIASHKPLQPGFTEAVLQRSGRLAVKFEPLETAGFYQDFLRQHASKAGTP
jgi:hypothetical protein